MVQDILIDDEADARIEDGDFVMGDSDPQHIILLINTSLGSWKQFPTAGVGIIQYSGSVGQGPTLSRIISNNLIADGYTILDLQLEQDSGGRFEYSVSAERL